VTKLTLPKRKPRAKRLNAALRSCKGGPHTSQKRPSRKRRKQELDEQLKAAEPDPI
jgi:hypothetical protein